MVYAVVVREIINDHCCGQEERARCLSIDQVLFVQAAFQSTELGARELSEKYLLGISMEGFVLRSGALRNHLKEKYSKIHLAEIFPNTTGLMLRVLRGQRALKLR